jgi:hypothetical protein
MTLTVTKRAFDLEKFAKVKLEGTVEFTPATDLAQALAQCEGKQDVLLNVVNKGLEKQAKINAKTSLTAPNVGSMKVINGFVNQFRLLPNFASISDRGEQTKAVYAFIQSTPVLIDQIKGAAIAALATEDNDDDDADNSAE